MLSLALFFFFFFFNDTATTEIYTLSLHDALPISWTLVSRVNKHQLDLGDGLAVARISDALLCDDDEEEAADDDDGQIGRAHV